MATGKESLFNGALAICGQTKLDSLTEAREARYDLDDAYDEDAIDHCLEEANWNFATRTIESNYDTSVSDPGFGFSRAFSKPTDWLKTVEISADEYFSNTLTNHDFVDEQGYWWCDLDTIYVRYVSNDSSYGADFSLWPQSFVRYFESYLALKISPKIFQSEGDLKRIAGIHETAKRDAKSKDAMNEGVKFHAPGGWANARRGGGRRGDRGNRNKLIG